MKFRFSVSILLLLITACAPPEVKYLGNYDFNLKEPIDVAPRYRINATVLVEPAIFSDTKIPMIVDGRKNTFAFINIDKEKLSSTTSNLIKIAFEKTKIFIGEKNHNVGEIKILPHFNIEPVYFQPVMWKDRYAKVKINLSLIFKDNDNLKIYEQKITENYTNATLSMNIYQGSSDTIQSAINNTINKLYVQLSNDITIVKSISSSYNEYSELHTSEHQLVKKKLKESLEFRKSIKPSISFSFTKNVENHNGIAVIIGNRNYKEASATPNVDYAINDASAIKEYVKKNLGYREGNIIYLEDASQAEFIGTLGFKDNPYGKLYDWVRTGESDVFIYYSGHGAPSLIDGKGYLLPIDADPQRVDLTGYPLETLYSNLAKIPAKSMTIILDACFSGSSNNGTVVKNASSIALKRAKTDKHIPNATILTAADASEVASWDVEAGHGLFTRYFLEGVTGAADKESFGNGDGMVMLGELRRYLESEVTYQARRNYGREQHPQVSGNNNFVLSALD